MPAVKPAVRGFALPLLAALLLGACGGRNTTPTSSSQPTATISAAPATIDGGGSATLTWNSTGAASCTASGGWSGTRAVSGTQSTGALTSSTSYSLTCTGSGGASTVATTTVTVAGGAGATLTATPTSVASGATSTLTWSSTDATYCTASGGWSGTKATSGSQSTGSLAVPTVYSISCVGPGGGSATASVTVNVVPLATITANPSVVTGGASTLTWSSINATSCTASGGWSGNVATSGSQATGTLTATTPFTLTCAGPGGTSNPAVATVTISDGTVTVSPKIAAITLGSTQSFAASPPGGGAVTWSVDGVAGGNATVGNISPGGLYTAGTAAGAHTVLATSEAASAHTGSAEVAVTDLAGVYTYHNDIARDGTNTREYALTTRSVNGAGFGKLFACAVDGAIYGQPLWVANMTVAGVKRNVVIVATAHDGLFAFDADASSCTRLWSVSLIDQSHGAPNPGETTVPAGTSPGNLVGRGYGDIMPEVGVIGTPVIDPATGSLYVVSKSMNSAGTAFYQRLHAIDPTTGNEQTGSPVTIAGTFPGPGGTLIAFNPQTENQRCGLAVINGLVYIAWAGHEDTPPYYGWIIGYAYNGTSFTQASALNVTPASGQGGIWMSGAAVAADANSYLYAITANGDFNPANNDYGDSLLKLTPSLAVSQYFTPSDQATDNSGDVDFGAGGAAVLADLPAGAAHPRLVMGGGKDGVLYVLDRDNLGGSGDGNAVQRLTIGGGIYATGAFWNNTFYIAATGMPLTSYTLDRSSVLFAAGSASAAVYGFPGGTPSVSANGAQGVLVWILDTSQYCTNQSPGCGPAVLHAYDAANLGTELWNSAAAVADVAGYAVKFAVPTVANGKVYVGTRGNNTGATSSVPGELDVYGLKP